MPPQPTYISVDSALAVVSLILGIVSLIQGFFSAWLAWHMKGEADKVNKDTIALLIDIRTDAKNIANVTAGELKLWGDTGRQAILGTTVSGKVDLGGIGESPDPPRISPISQRENPSDAVQG